MASPRTRRVLQDLRPTNENTVSESYLSLFLLFHCCDNILLFKYEVNFVFIKKKKFYPLEMF